MDLPVTTIRTDSDVAAKPACFAGKNCKGSLSLNGRLMMTGGTILLIGEIPDLPDVAGSHLDSPPIRSKGLTAGEERPIARWT